MLTEAAPPIALALNAEAAPDWIELIPAGPNVVGADGRSWRMEDPSGLADAFNQAARPAPLDWEHAGLLRGAKGERAPAAGWIEQLDARNGAIWGRVSWTDDGRRDVESRGYRFVSPVFAFNRANKRITAFRGAGLTNTPNLTLAALNRADNTIEDDMDLTHITAALGLDAGASANQIVTAINRRADDLSTATAAAQRPDPDKWISKSEYDLALNQLETYRQAEADAHTAKIEQVVDAVIAVGDPAHPPANRDDYIAMCRAEGGFERFQRVVKPQLGNALTASVAPAGAPTGAASILTEEETAVCRQLGLGAADYIAAKGAAQ